ncbi:MAG: PIN domain-containing protein [Bryobacteraceae bacterium]|nr:PIN domain-containing protein [Bryobacteraceae bacterium]
MLLKSAFAAGERLVTDAEVLQEILHRYTAINRRDAIMPALRALLDVVDEVLAIEKQDVLRAAEITQNPALLSARDAIHVAIMERHAIASILTVVQDFTDEVPVNLDAADAARTRSEGFAYTRVITLEPAAATLKLALCDHQTGRAGSVLVPAK